MIRYPIRVARALVTGAALSALLGPAMAQDAYPSRPITIVVTNPAGGVVDVFARPFSAALSKRLGQPIVVDYRPGANGNIGATYVARTQPADGYTLLFGGISTMTINRHLYRSQDLNPLKELQPLTMAFQSPNALITAPKSPYRTQADVVAAAKAAPGTIPFASTGNGNTTHLLGLQFQEVAGISMVHVPYKGGPPAVNDLMGNQVPLLFHSLSAVVNLHKQGMVRILSIASDKRSPTLPDVPTMAEAGLPGLASVSQAWTGLLVRSGTPAPIVDRLAKEIGEVLKDPAFRAPLEAQDFQVLHTTPEEFAKRMRSDDAAFSALIKANNVQID